MKKALILTIILGVMFNQKSVYAQKTGEVVGLAAAGALVGAIGISLAIEQYKEQLELHATEYILDKHPDFTRFRLSVLDLEGVKLADLSNISCVTFSLQIVKPMSNEKRVLFIFLSKGWINQNGIDFTRVRYNLINKEEWSNLLFTYL